jgi:hypothetical protein
MDVLFRYIVFDDFGEPHKRFRTKHEAEVYIANKPNHKMEYIKAPKQPKENIFEIYEEAPF